MNTSNATFTNVDAYIEAAEEEAQPLLKQIRSTVLKAAPHAQESISYGMPAYKLNGKPLVYFAAFKNHIGFYATPAGHEAFAKELAKYKQGKGSVQFPMNKPMPIQLISDMVAFKVLKSQEKKK